MTKEQDTAFNVLLVTGLAALVCIVFYYNSKDIQLKIAYNGYGPQDYVAQKIHPENFQKDFAPGMLLYDNSIPMRFYYYLAKYCGISPTTTMYPFMFIQTLLFLLSVAFLTQTLFQNKLVTSISVVIIPLSNLAGLNLSRFGVGYGSLLSFPLFYGYSNAFRFFAIGFFLRNKYIPCFIFLALSIYCHVNMGLFALAFIGAYLLYKPQLIREKSFLLGIFVFLVLVAPHLLSIISNVSVSSGAIPVDQWVKSTRIFSFHWYPFTMKLFTKNAHREFFPFLLLCFFFFVALRYHGIKNEKNVKIIVGFIACLIMSLFGIIFSDIYPIPFLIKISFQRSTGLITFFGFLYLIYYLFKKAETGDLFNVFLATYSLLVFAFGEPGIAILPLFLLLYSDIEEGRFGLIKISSSKNNIVKLLYYTAAILLLLLILDSIFKDHLSIANSIFVHLWTPLQYFNPFYSFDFLLRGGGFKVCPIFIYLLIGSALMAGAIITLRETKNKALTLALVSIFFAMSVSIVWYLERDKYQRWHNRNAKRGSAYLDVQLWAKNNTIHDALFMPDPSHSYGWRDFSERSSFGNFREWGYCAIVYNPNLKIYQEGLRRMREFGIDIEKITQQDLKESDFYGPSKLYPDIRSTYYKMSVGRLQRLCRKYGIDYFVMNRRLLNASQQIALTQNFKTAYKNNQFFVFTRGKGAPPFFAEGQDTPVFESSFRNWKGPNTIKMHDLPKTAPPLSMQGFRGDFNFTCISYKDGNIIRVAPFRKSKKDELVIQFGYTLGMNGFNLELPTGKEVFFIISGRLSNRTKKPTVLFIQDKRKTWERNSVIMDNTSWDQYIVSKRIRDGATDVCFGINWQPKAEKEWLEIKNARIFIVNQNR